MNDNNTVKIGSVLKWRDTYSADTKYYQENIVTLGGCVFRCKALSTTGQPPLSTADEKGHLSFANTDVWNVVVDMLQYYNWMLDTNQLAKENQEYIKRVEEQVKINQQEIEALKQADQALSARIDQNKAAVEKAQSTADKNRSDLDVLTKDVYELHSAASLWFSTNLIEKGVDVNITVNWKSTYKSALITPVNSKITNTTSGVIISTDSNSSKNITINDETSFSFETEIVAGVKKTATGTVKARYPLYLGTNAKDAIDGAAVLSMNKQSIRESPAGSYSFAVGAGEYMWLCVPDGMTVRSVKSSGFDVPMQPVTVVAVSGKGNYNCYRSASKFTAQTVNISIS